MKKIDGVLGSVFKKIFYMQFLMVNVPQNKDSNIKYNIVNSDVLCDGKVKRIEAF